MYKRQVLDCDLQHPPEKILEMYRLWQEGWQVVEGIKVSRGRENPVHTLAARTIGGLLAEADIPYELLFVNDGSRDHTWQAIQKAAEQDPRVRGIRFSRNFGKEAAIFAGLAQARGACCVVLDLSLIHI